MAKVLRKLRITEVSLVDRPACPGAEIKLFKRAKEVEDMDELERHLRDLEPDLDWDTRRQAAYGTAIQKHAGDATVAALYEVAKRDAPEPALVEKSAVPGDAVWSTIEKLARQLREDRPGTLTQIEAINAVLEKRPDLYRMYCREQAELE